jgi:hypothetical protein
MDDREHPSIGRVIIEVAMPMVFALMLASLLSGPGLVLILVVIGLCSGPAFILLTVRSLNDRDDPRHSPGQETSRRMGGRFS